MERCAQLFAEGDLDKDGKARVAAPLCRMPRHSVPLRVLTQCAPQLSYDSFLKLFNLKSDHYTQSLCKVFDSDNSGQIGFRECAPRARCTAPRRAGPAPLTPSLRAPRFIYNLAKFHDESCVPCHALPAPVKPDTAHAAVSLRR
jgi:hypothetical protein